MTVFFVFGLVATGPMMKATCPSSVAGSCGVVVKEILLVPILTTSERSRFPSPFTSLTTIRAFDTSNVTVWPTRPAPW